MGKPYKKVVVEYKQAIAKLADREKALSMANAKIDYLQKLNVKNEQDLQECEAAAISYFEGKIKYLEDMLTRFESQVRKDSILFDQLMEEIERLRKELGTYQTGELEHFKLLDMAEGAKDALINVLHQDLEEANKDKDIFIKTIDDLASRIHKLKHS